MKRIFNFILFLLIVTGANAQGVPFVIDENFTPDLTYVQGTWSGEYVGLVPQMRSIINVKRTITLSDDMTYCSEMLCQRREGGDFLTLRYEKGEYSYDCQTKKLTYSVYCDSTLDLAAYLADPQADPKYIVGNYEDSNPETYSEQMSFTHPDSQDKRFWVAFDHQLMSPQDPMRSAVYTMERSADNSDSVHEITIADRRYKSWTLSRGRLVLTITEGNGLEHSVIF